MISGPDFKEASSFLPRSAKDETDHSVCPVIWPRLKYLDSNWPKFTMKYNLPQTFSQRSSGATIRLKCLTVQSHNPSWFYLCLYRFFLLFSHRLSTCPMVNDVNVKVNNPKIYFHHGLKHAKGRCKKVWILCEWIWHILPWSEWVFSRFPPTVQNMHVQVNWILFVCELETCHECIVCWRLGQD